MSIDATLQALAGFPRLLEMHYREVPAGYERWTPSSWEGIPSERFNAIEQLLHVRDIEVEGYRVRFQRILAEDQPLLEDIDSYALARQRGYEHDNDAQRALVEFRVAREHLVRRLSALHPDDLARRAVFPGHGPVTARGLMHFLCSHDQQHLAGLQWLLGRIDASRMQA